MPFSAIVYKPGTGKSKARSAHVLYGPYVSREATSNAGAAYARSVGLSRLDVGTLESSKVDQFFAGTGKHYTRQNPARCNPDILDAIRPGMRVTIVNRFGQQQSGKAVMRGPAGWVLNLGGAHGTPGIATPENIVKVSGKPSARSLFGSRIMNPAGPSAIPAKWTPATVSRKGPQIQIRMGGR